MSALGTGLLAFLIAFIVICLTVLALNFTAAKQWASVHTGTHYLVCGKGSAAAPCPQQIYYNFWSGFGSDIAEITLVSAVIGATVGGYRKINCHSKGCPWIGHYELEVKHNDTDPGTKYKVCHRCHPHIDGQRFRRHELHALHHRHIRENIGHPVAEAQAHDGT